MRHWLMCVWVCEVCMCVCAVLGRAHLWVGHAAPQNRPLPACAQSGDHRTSPKASRLDASPVPPRAPRQPSPRRSLFKPPFTPPRSRTHRPPPTPQNRPPHAGAPHAAQSRNCPGASRTTVYLLPAAVALPPLCTLSRPTGARSAAAFAARGPRAPRRRCTTSRYSSASPAAASSPPRSPPRAPKVGPIVYIVYRNTTGTQEGRCPIRTP